MVAVASKDICSDVRRASSNRRVEHEAGLERSSCGEQRGNTVLPACRRRSRVSASALILASVDPSRSARGQDRRERIDTFIL